MCDVSACAARSLAPWHAWDERMDVMVGAPAGRSARRRTGSLGYTTWVPAPYGPRAPLWNIHLIPSSQIFLPVISCKSHPPNPLITRQDSCSWNKLKQEVRVTQLNLYLFSLFQMKWNSPLLRLPVLSVFFSALSHLLLTCPVRCPSLRNRDGGRRGDPADLRGTGQAGEPSRGLDRRLGPPF